MSFVSGRFPEKTLEKWLFVKANGNQYPRYRDYLFSPETKGGGGGGGGTSIGYP